MSVNKNVVTQLPIPAAMCAIFYCSFPPQWTLTAGTVHSDKLFPIELPVVMIFYHSSKRVANTLPYGNGLKHRVKYRF